MKKEDFLKVYKEAEKEDWFDETMEDLMWDELDHAYECGQDCGYSYGYDAAKSKDRPGFWF